MSLEGGDGGQPSNVHENTAKGWLYHLSGQTHCRSFQT